MLNEAEVGRWNGHCHLSRQRKKVIWDDGFGGSHHLNGNLKNFNKLRYEIWVPICCYLVVLLWFHEFWLQRCKERARKMQRGNMRIAGVEREREMWPAIGIGIVGQRLRCRPVKRHATNTGEKALRPNFYCGYTVGGCSIELVFSKGTRDKEALGQRQLAEIFNMRERVLNEVFGLMWAMFPPQLVCFPN